MVIAELVLKYMADVSSMKATLADIEKQNASIQKAAQETAQSIKGVAQSLNNAGAMIQNSIALLGTLGLTRLGMAVAQAAGRADEMQRVMYVVGKNAGYSRAELDKYESSVRKMGITTEEARKTIVKMIQANIGLEKSSQLARAAQDLAVIAGWNSSETLERLVINIQQADTLGLRFMGIVIDQAEAQQEFARQTGIVGRELTRQEKTQATLNAVLREAGKLQGTYEEAMNSWTKTARTTERYVAELKAALGKGLQEPLLVFERALQKNMETLANLDAGTLKAVGTFTLLAGVLGSVATAFNLLSKATGASAKGIIGTVGAITLLSTTKVGEDLIEWFTKTLGKVPEYMKSVSNEVKKLGDQGEALRALGEGLGWGVLGAYLFGKGGKFMKVLGLVTGFLGFVASLAPRAEEEEVERLEETLGMKRSLKEKDIMAAKGKEGIEELRKNKRLLEAEITTLNREKEEFAKKYGVDESKLFYVGPGAVEKNVRLAELDAYVQAIKKREETIASINKRIKDIKDEEQRARDAEVLETRSNTLSKLLNLDEQFASLRLAKTEEEQKKLLELFKEEYRQRVAYMSQAQREELMKALALKDPKELDTLFNVLERKFKDFAENEKSRWTEIQKLYDSVIKSLPTKELEKLELVRAKLEREASIKPGQPGYNPEALQALRAVQEKIKKEQENLIETLTKSLREFFKQVAEELEQKQAAEIEAYRTVVEQYLSEYSYLVSKIGDQSVNQWELANQLKSTYDALGKAFDNMLTSIDNSLERSESLRKKMTEDAQFEVRKMMDSFNFTQTQKAEMERLIEKQSLEEKKKNYNEALKHYQSTLNEMVNAQKSAFAKLRELEAQRVAVIKQHEETIKDIETSTEDKVRSMKQRLMKPQELREDKIKQAEERQQMAESLISGSKENRQRAKAFLTKASEFWENEYARNEWELSTAISKVREIGGLLKKIEEADKQERLKEIEEQKQAIQNQLQVLEEGVERAKTALKELEKVALEVNENLFLQIDPSQPLEAIESIRTALESLTNRTWTIRVQTVQIGNPEALRVGAPATEAPTPPGMATGGQVLGGYGGGDRVPAMLEPGEFVHRKEAVSYYGSAFMEAINSLKFPKMPTMSLGGSVSNSIDNRKWDNSQSWVLHFSGGGSVTPSSNIKRLVAELTRELEREYRRS